MKWIFCENPVFTACQCLTTYGATDSLATRKFEMGHATTLFVFPWCCHKWLPPLKLAIHLSFLAFRHVRALFRELFHEIANRSLYTSHNITDFIHLWFCEKLDEKLSLSPLWRFVKIPTVWRERRNARWEKWLARWFTKCHLYTYHLSHFANIFSCSHQFNDKCIAGFTTSKKRIAWEVICNERKTHCSHWANHDKYVCVFLPMSNKLFSCIFRFLRG